MWRRVRGKLKPSKFYVSTFFAYDILSKINFGEAIADMHIIAYCYHWDRDTIFELPRLERKMWAAIILKTKKAEADSIK